MNCLTRNKKREYLKNVIDMPLLANLSIAHTVEHSAVNRVVVGSSPTGGAKRCHYQQSVDDAGGPPRVLADFAHWEQILRSALVSLRPSSFLQKAGLFGDRFSRTRKLSPVVPKIVPWRRGVKIGRCQHSIVSISYVKLLCGFTNHIHACFNVFMVWGNMD